MTFQSRVRKKFRLGTRGETLKDKLKDLLFGFFFYGLHQQVTITASKYRDIVHILILGEAFGIPILGNYYTLRLIPYLIEYLPEIKELASKEVDILEHLHEGTAVH